MEMIKTLWDKLQNTNQLSKPRTNLLLLKAASFIIFGSLIFTPTKVKAGLFLEPYLGYGLGVQEYNLKSGSSPQSVSSYSAPNGVTIGGRLGWSLGPLYVAGDYSTYSWDGSIPGVTLNATMGAWTFSSMGVTAIFSPPVLPLRVWVGYQFSEKLTQKYGSVEFSKTGTAFKFGGSFTVLPLVMASLTLNVEYIMANYGDFALSNDKGSVNLSGNTLTFGDLKQNTVLISIGLPFDIPFT